MSELRFSDLIDASVPLWPEEAVALTLAAVEALDGQEPSSAGMDDRLLLSSTGRVSLASVSHTDVDDTTAISVTFELAGLTRRLLQLDKPRGAGPRHHIPGPLLVLLARATGHIDLPAPDPTEFREALERFGRPDPTTLAAVFWRAARIRAPMRTDAPHVTLPAVKVESILAPRGADDRRHNAPPSSELRRYLRETERELFEARVYAQPSAPLPVRYAQLPARSHSAPSRSAGRLWRISSGIAATVVGAVIGTFMAFLLAGITNGPQGRVPGTPRAVSATVVERAATPRPERTIRTERTVQPLLLAAAVGAEVFSPSFAPRGRTLLFHAGRESAPLMRASVSDTGEVNRIETLLDDGAANHHVTMSPDGSRIAFDSDRDGVRSVYVAQADGTGSTRISGLGYAAVPSWSPDGAQLAFVRAEPKQPRVLNVWIAEVRSGNLRRVTSHVRGEPWGASWFPDGQHIAYSVEDRLMVADLQSGVARGYRSPRAGRFVRTPAVSPDGRQIVFQVQRDGVWLLDVKRERMRRILADATAEQFVWSPDGGAIAYHARRGGSYGLWRLALNTSGN